MTVRVEEGIDIGRAPEDVWAFVVERANDPLWCSKVKTVQPTADGAWDVWHRPIPLRSPVLLRTEHLLAEPPGRLTMREEDDGSVFDVEYRLEPNKAGTRFTQVSEFKFKRLPRGLHVILARGVRRDVRVQLRALKDVLEGRLAS
jgi:hypothetical protein